MMDRAEYKVMVVDDDESVRESLRKVLEGEGYEVNTAANGADALDLFRQDPAGVDLLLMDLNMPLKNGWVTLHQLLEINPSVPIFIITAFSNQREIAAASGAGALVEKPIDVQKLLELIESRRNPPVVPLLGRGRLAFCHVPAAGHRLAVAGPKNHVEAHDHWGINE